MIVFIQNMLAKTHTPISLVKLKKLIFSYLLFNFKFFICKYRLMLSTTTDRRVVSGIAYCTKTKKRQDCRLNGHLFSFMSNTVCDVIVRTPLRKSLRAIEINIKSENCFRFVRKVNTTIRNPFKIEVIIMVMILIASIKFGSTII